MSYRILFIAELVGKSGVLACRKGIKALKKELDIDFVIANGNGATGGFGLGKNHSLTIKKSGVDVITGGDYLFFKKDLVEFLPKCSFVLRPANYTQQTPGRGWGVFNAKDRNIGVINLLGPSGINKNHPSNPYTYVESVVERIKDRCDIIIINFHSRTTAEKQLIFHIIDGKVSAVLGSGMRSITADSKISDKKTAFITDTGRTGSSDSPGGLSPDIEIQKLLTGIPQRSRDTSRNLEIQGVIIDFDSNNQPIEITPLRRKVVSND